MDLPDCPPGAEGYQDSVVEMPKKPDTEESSCTKAEQEFQDHLNSLKIKLENGETRCMVERRGRDISGKWIYLCYPCGSVCSGESILQTHISGKKHKSKLAMKSSWPMSIFDDHPFNQNQKGGPGAASTATEKVLQKMAAEVEMHKAQPSDLEQKYNKYRTATCHIQDILDALKAPLVGVEYLVEHPPEKAHYEPAYICTLCTKQGHPRTIVNHLTCFWHRYNYLLRHFSKACARMSRFKNIHKYREGVSVTMHRLAQRIEDKFGRLKPVNIDKEEYEKEKESILQWIYKGYHFSEVSGITLEEVVDVDLIENLAKTAEEGLKKVPPVVKKRDPSPPVVAAPSRPHLNVRSGRKERRMSMDSISDVSDDEQKRGSVREKHNARERAGERPRHVHPIEEPRREEFRGRYPTATVRHDPDTKKEQPKKNYEYKVQLAEEKAAAAAESAATMLAYHEKNPEKHPLYPEEWKKFWNRRYKEIQAEGKDASKHDFKPEWIVFWTKRMKELHAEELKTQVTEIYRRMNVPLPEEPCPGQRRQSQDRRRSPDTRRPVWELRKPDRGHERHRSPEGRRRSLERLQDRRRSPPRRAEHRPSSRRTPDPRYSIDRRPGSHRDVRPSPPKRPRSRSPTPRQGLPPRPQLRLEPGPAVRSRSPLSRRESELRNRSPEPRARSPHLAPSLQTVMISDDELKPDDGLSPWNSDVESVESPRSRAGSMVSSHMSSFSHSRARSHRSEAADLGPPENIVATLRVLVALEDYLGSLGPKIVDLLTDALKMEKERANSSEDLLEREEAVVLIETAKEKLKGAAQAGLVPAAAAPALKAAIMRAAATLHEADTRTRRKLQEKKTTAAASKASGVPVAGVGEVDRALIAQQMAAALIAQGKTDVTSEELAQLVDAVVGMAEAKKREAEASKKVEVRPLPPRPQAKMSGTATALQMLQSAYDENDAAKNEKKVEKENTPDAMDGLSDSDLETLLKNFNELSAEEQHSLIAYLKKLEAREPQRVERLRQYVSTAATNAPVEDPQETLAAAVNPEPPVVPAAVSIESDDDDDYTVEEVFKSAKARVKEDQIRKELDIVKKSLEVSKDETPPVKASVINPAPVINPTPSVDLSKHLSSASDLFALVQASISSSSNTQTSDVVASSTQPRSFGDVPEKPLEPAAKSQNLTLIQLTGAASTPQFDRQDEPMDQGQQTQQHFNMNYQNEHSDQNDSYDQSQWNQRQNNDMPDDRDQGNDYGQDQFQESNQYDQGPNQYGQEHNQGQNQFNQGINSGQNQYNQQPNQGQSQFGQGQKQFGQLDTGSNQFGQGANSGPNQYGQGTNSGPNQFRQGPNSGSNQFSQGSNSGPNQLGQGSNSGPNQFGQGSNSGPNQFGQGSNSGPNQFGQGSNSGPKQFGQGSNSGPNQFGQGSNSGPNQFGQGSNSGPNQFGQGPNKEWQGNQRQNPWQSAPFHQGQNQFNQGSRGNMNGRNENFGNRPQPFENMNQQQFGNYDNHNNNNFRGRGRGNFGGGPMRGRGRARY